MRKADFSIDTVIQFILLIVGILLLVALITAIVTNAETIGNFITELVGGFF